MPGCVSMHARATIFGLRTKAPRSPVIEAYSVELLHSRLHVPIMFSASSRNPGKVGVLDLS